MSHAVLKVAQLRADSLGALLSRYGLPIVWVREQTPIPGSFWGETEAGLAAGSLQLRADTPVHSALHEASHFVCMDPQRRRKLDTDAGGDYDEENAVCYLQILLAGVLPGVGRERMWADMDAWAYTFRLGSARAWFENDAGDARDWLLFHRLIDENSQPTWCLRGQPAPVCA